MNTIRPANILVPKDCDDQKWSVVACDQFTSERGYWKKLEDFVGDAPSTLKLVFPEVYLEDGDKQQRIDSNAVLRSFKRCISASITASSSAEAFSLNPC